MFGLDILLRWPFFFFFVAVGLVFTAVYSYLLGRINPTAIIAEDAGSLDRKLLAALFEVLTALLAMAPVAWFAGIDPGWLSIPILTGQQRLFLLGGTELALIPGYERGQELFLVGNIEFALTAIAKYWCVMFCLAGRDMRLGEKRQMLTLGAVSLVIDWRVALLVWGGFLLLTALTRSADLGALWAGTALPLATWYCFPEPLVIIFSLLCASQVIRPYLKKIRALLERSKQYDSEES